LEQENARADAYIGGKVKMTEQAPKTAMERLKTLPAHMPTVTLTITFPDDRSPSETFSLPTKGSSGVNAARALNRLLSKCVKVS
jgi:hypothetical protein